MMLALRLTLLSPLVTVALASTVLEPRSLLDAATFSCLAVLAVFSTGVVAGTPVVLVLACAALLDGPARRAA